MLTQLYVFNWGTHIPHFAMFWVTYPSDYLPGGCLPIISQEWVQNDFLPEVCFPLITEELICEDFLLVLNKTQVVTNNGSSSVLC